MIWTANCSRNGPAAEELEFCGIVADDCGAMVAPLEVGDETLDFASLLDVFNSLPTISFFEGPCDWVIMPYNTSAISISSSSGFDEDDFVDDLGGLSLGPFGFWKKHRKNKKWAPILSKMYQIKEPNQRRTKSIETAHSISNPLANLNLDGKKIEK